MLSENHSLQEELKKVEIVEKQLQQTTSNDERKRLVTQKILLLEKIRIKGIREQGKNN